jgi:hypothetical protein
VIQVFSPLSSAVMSLMQQTYSILKASFFSYFLIDIISFWTLSLMYSFLNLPTVPLFSKYFFEKMEKILFKLDSILEFVFKMNPGLSTTLDFSSIGGRELID